jgi:hypothetical protein
VIDRRNVLKWGVVAPVLVGAPYAAVAVGPEGLDGFVLDRRFLRERPAGLHARALYSIDGDVTALWYETLDPLWRKPGFVLGGITGRDALFVLETLAPDRGRRVVSRKDLSPGNGEREGPVSWVIAPVHPSVRV